MSYISVDSNELFGPSTQWLSEANSQQSLTLGATSLSHQDSPPTYDAAMADTSTDSGAARTDPATLRDAWIRDT